MILKTGTVTISEKEILVEGFTFEGVTGDTASAEAVAWAKARLDSEVS